jgi:hypothetical protein
VHWQQFRVTAAVSKAHGTRTKRKEKKRKDSGKKKQGYVKTR